MARARQSDFQFEQHISSLQDHLAAAQSGFDALQTIQNTSTNRVFWIATAVGGLSFVLFLANRYFSSHNNTSVPTTVSTGAITINPPNIILPPVVQVGPSPSPFSARVLEFSLIALGAGLVSFFRKKINACSAYPAIYISTNYFL